MRIHPIGVAVSAALLASAAPLLAQSHQITAAVAGASLQGDFSRFTPRPASKATRLDFSFWDDALEYMVLPMGPSTRQGERRPDATLGTRQVYGHDSRIRLEGNRIAFNFLSEETTAPLSEYRRDLERIGSEVDIASLPRNEQLAFWINLHNVAVTEMIALNYPTRSPSELKLGPDKTPLDTTRFITVAGVAMSPHDIRTKIVFPNWSDAQVIYGFFRGEVGSPSIQRIAFTGDNVSALLDGSAKEFVNSLRGVEAIGSNLLVSKIYEEAAPFYFSQMGDDLKAHLLRFAGEEVARLVAEKRNVKTNTYVATVADLAGGEREPIYNTVTSNDLVQGTRISPSIARYLGERSDKYEKLRREGLLRGTVIWLPSTGVEAEQTPAAPVVE